MLVVGSKALEFHGINIGRKCGDLDVICVREEFEQLALDLVNQGHTIRRIDNSKPDYGMISTDKIIVDASIINDTKSTFFGSDHWLYHNLDKVDYVKEDNFRYIKPEFVLMMKWSHRYKGGVFFEKTRNDIFYLWDIGIELDRYLHKMASIREDFTINKGYKLNVTKKQFFTDNVPYKYDHDSIHRAVAIYEKPAYTHYLKDGEEVMCDKDKFYACSPNFRMAGVIEEACVLALERAVIPFGTDPKRAYKMALQKVCTSITKGWFREFAWYNYEKALAFGETYDYDVMFKEAQAKGLILPYSKSY
jgi:hypothetical protein